MSSGGSPDPSEMSQKKREWNAQADEASKAANSEATSSPDVAQPESQRKKIREEDADTPSETSSPPNSNRSEQEAAAAKGESHRSPPTSGGSSSTKPSEEPAAASSSDSTAPSQPGSGSGGFRFGSSKPLSFGSFAVKSGASPFAAVTASSGAASLDALPENTIRSSGGQKGGDKAKANAATTVVMAKSNSGDEAAAATSSDQESETSAAEDSPASGAVGGFTVSTLGEEPRRRTEMVPVKVVTGEEEEKKLFEMRGKLYEFEDNTWRERGVGLCHINTSKSDEKSRRLVMRRDRTMQLILNTKLVPGMEPSVKDKSIYFSGMNLAGEPRSFAIRVKNAEYADDFYTKLEQLCQLK
ncbi:hypothetical protein SYNPS1DRAFT_30551 [Syncephalis pseudoplumigaleata]|uniref:RanBD1 domain-containing protein n=1 Tax=Syncephalis pseudoplumigaleata TaxID=1712513 RepID=A0A4P9YV09_9FUNG|nr:hypothetical protein SYNPS1DRAFT_30551 [Syncephalis pseudoplumigaleata]|eukprot:RKP23694.1 hypothetical protein SYNPS1DRAFT_30551 [Syncephalis pseudoplumigaleata]